MADADEPRILVFANEVAGGRKLLEAVRKRADAGARRFYVVAPQNQPQAGHLIYDESVREAAQNRLDITLGVLREAGIEAEGEVMDPHPALALEDAIRVFEPTEVIVSSRPDTRFGLLRKDLVEHARHKYDLPFEQVFVRIEDDAVSGDVTHTLVVANQTVASGDLIGHLKRKATESRHRFTIICPVAGTSPEDLSAAKERLAKTLSELYREGIDATGQVMNPDAFTSVQNALQYYQVDSILISTLPNESSKWMQSDLIGRVEKVTAKPVEHVVAGSPAAAEAPVEPAGV